MPRYTTWLFYQSSYIIDHDETGAIYVLHALRKKTQKTRREDIELARQRYRQIEE
ncbi:MAG TPA: type II toxin-antitoxin system RelE/ParE family toxin [Anaerolineae bacterium]|nr:type II toxin-antitoxin system RelE/ParE family toxin [Anaerolineae bacterium]